MKKQIKKHYLFVFWKYYNVLPYYFIVIIPCSMYFINIIFFIHCR